MPAKIDLESIAKRNPKVDLVRLEEYRALRRSLGMGRRIRQSVSPLERRRVRIVDDIESDPRVVHLPYLILRAVTKYRKVEPDGPIIDGERTYSAKLIHEATEQLDADLAEVFSQATAEQQATIDRLEDDCVALRHNLTIAQQKNDADDKVIADLRRELAALSPSEPRAALGSLPPAPGENK